MKNKKLNLNELKVKSFVTDLENEKENTVKGGTYVTEGWGLLQCNTADGRSWCICMSGAGAGNGWEC